MNYVILSTCPYGRQKCFWIATTKVAYFSEQQPFASGIAPTPMQTKAAAEAAAHTRFPELACQWWASGFAEDRMEATMPKPRAQKPNGRILIHGSPFLYTATNEAHAIVRATRLLVFIKREPEGTQTAGRQPDISLYREDLETKGLAYSKKWETWFYTQPQGPFQPNNSEPVGQAAAVSV